MKAKLFFDAVTRLLLCIAAVISFGPSVANAQTQLAGRIEVHALRSKTFTGEEFLRGNESGRDALVGGELRLPVGAPAKVPVLILVHGSGGVGSGVDAWARVFNEAGVGVFILDSFSGRGIVSTVEDQEQLHSLAMMVDTYRALDMLAVHPKIRADRIAVMGFSKGAVAAIYSATDRFRTSHGSTNQFAAHIGMYTPCNTKFEGDTKVSSAPLRLYHGIADDYVNIAPCRTFAADLKASGADVLLTEYAEAQHGFDSPTLPPLLAVPRAQSTRNCSFKEGPNGTTLNAFSLVPYSIKNDPCVAIGAHVGYNAEATASARQSVIGLVKQVLLN